MTIRDYIRRRMWTWGAVALGSWVLVAFGAAISKGGENGALRPLLPLVGFAGFASAIVAMQFFVKCPKCRARLAQTIAMYVAFQWGGKRPVNFCPFCGVNLDEPVPGSNLAPHSQSPQNPIFPT
jgi:hypothetical protein